MEVLPSYTFHPCPEATYSVRCVSDEVLLLLILGVRTLLYLVLRSLWAWLFCDKMTHCEETVKM